jgi:hypothetical protein
MKSLKLKAYNQIYSGELNSKHSEKTLNPQNVSPFIQREHLGPKINEREASQGKGQINNISGRRKD